MSTSIACATDFSQRAEEAASAAAQLARRSGAQLELLHVLGHPLEETFQKALRSLSASALATEAERLELLAGKGKVTQTLLSGRPAAQLLAWVEKARPAMMFVGVPSTSEEEPSTRLSSVLAERAAAPVVQVRSASPFAAWAQGRRPLRVVVGVDRSASFEAAREWLRWLGELGPLELIAAHAFWPSSEAWRLGEGRRADGAPELARIQRALEQEVRALVEPLGPQVTVKLLPAVGRLADHLVDFAAEQHADLLVVGTHHRRGLGKLGSVSHHALRLAPMSIALVPVAAPKAQVTAAVIRRVLVATDFSPASREALGHALGLVPSGGALRLLHVAREGSSAEEKGALMAKLTALLPTRALPDDVAVDVEVVDGPEPGIRIAQAAERFNAELVCLGERRAPGALTAVLGSVAQEAVGALRRPVLLVREKG